MSTVIDIHPMSPGQYGVQVEEGDVRTSHVVTVPEGLLDDLAIGDVDPEVLVRESFAFLLEREPATAILREFSLDQLSRHFPEYSDEILRRLS